MREKVSVALASYNGEKPLLDLADEDLFKALELGWRVELVKKE